MRCANSQPGPRLVVLAASAIFSLLAAGVLAEDAPAPTNAVPGAQHAPDRLIVGFRVPAEARVQTRSIKDLEAAGVAAVEPLAEGVKAAFPAILSREKLLRDVPSLEALQAARAGRRAPMGAGPGALNPNAPAPARLPELPIAENPLKYAYMMHVQPGTDIPALCRQIAARPEVAYAEPDYVASICLTPNDTRYGSLWGMTKIKADQAWNVSTGSQSIRVAVIDTGISYTHPDLAGPRFINGFDFANNDSDSTDDHYHGTHVAGTVGATINNSAGVAGVAQCQIVGVKVLSASGSGFYSWIVDGINWSVNNGAHVLNLSLGGTSPDGALQAAVNFAVASNRLVVCAAGNSSTTAPLYPAAYSNSLSVVATDAADAKALFSNFGPTVDISAPGTSILSTFPGAQYQYLQGTSMAAPHVAGAAALVWGQNVGLSAAQVRSIIEANSDDLGSPGRDDTFGHGRINLQRAFASLGSTPTIITPSPLPDGTINTVYAPVNLAASGGYPPLTWTSVPLRQDLLANTILTTGSLRNWRADEQVWQVQLPFGFPYGGATYTKLWASSNGFLDFSVTAPSSDYNNSSSLLAASRRIAPLWDDLSTDGVFNIPEDVYTSQPTADSFMIRWQAHTYANDQSANFSATLFRDGRIRFDYGEGNTLLTPTIGLGFGSGPPVLVPDYDGAASLTFSDSVLFTPGAVPSGMTLSPSGELSGTPAQGGQFDLRVQATDNLGRQVQKSLSLSISDPGLLPARVIAMSPVPNNQIWSSKQPAEPFQQTIQFNKHVNIAASAISVIGTTTGVRPFTFSYDAATFTATIVMSGPLAEDTYTFTIDAAQVTDGSGFQLDGEIVNGQLPSGDLVQGGNTVWTYNVIPWWQELRGNTYTIGDQLKPAISMLPDGRFVIVWESNGQDGSENGVYAQLFDASGTRRGGEIQCNSYTALRQSDPDVAMAPDGSFVVTWESIGQVQANNEDVWSRRFDANGAPIGDEFRTSLSVGGDQFYPSIGMGPTGSFVIAWWDTNEHRIYGNRYPATGPFNPGEFPIDAPSGPSITGFPSLCVLADDSFIVAWRQYLDPGDPDAGVRARRFVISGGVPQPAGPQFSVNQYTPGNQSEPCIVADSLGGFIVSWTVDAASDGLGSGVFARRYGADGTPLTNEFRVCAQPAIYGYSSVAAGPRGTATFIWSGGVTEDKDVSGRRVDSQGQAIGHPFRVNTHTPGIQRTNFPRQISSDAAGNFIAVWQSAAQDGSGDGAYGQYFDVTPPRISSVSPSPSSLLSSTSTNVISVTFNQDVVVGTTQFSVIDDINATHSNFALSYNQEAKTATLTFPSALPSGRQYVVRVDGDPNTGVFRRDPRPGITIGADDFQVFLDGDWTDYSQPSGDGAEGGDAVWAFTVARDAPWNGESRLNFTLAGNQTNATAAGLRDDLFVAAWQADNADGSGLGVMACRFNPFGYRIGSEFPVNTTTSSDQANPRMAAFRNGDFVVAWDGNGTGDADGVFARKFNAEGIPVTGEIRVNATTADVQSVPAIDISPDGQVVVAWQSVGQKGSGSGIFTRILAEDLSFSSSEIQVNTSTTGNQTNPDVAWLESGGFVIAWETPDGASTGIMAQAFSAEFLKDGGEFGVNATLLNSQLAPRLAPVPGGGFLAVWADDAFDGSGWGIVGRPFAVNPGGDPPFNAAAEFIVTQTTAGDQARPDVARLSGPDLVVCWEGPGIAADRDVFQRRISAATLQPIGTDERMNAHLPANQNRPTIGALSDGDFVVVWDGEGPFADTQGIFGRWFDATPPTILSTMTTTNEQGVTSLTIQFSEPVGVQLNSMSVVGQIGGAQSFTGDYDDHAWQLTLAFALPLPPDAYTLTVPFSAVSGFTGSSLDGDANGLPGGTYMFQFSAAPIVPGDMNCDGDVNGLDVQEFLRAVFAPNGWTTAHPTCNLLNGDFDASMSVTPDDTAGFAALILSQ